MQLAGGVRTGIHARFELRQTARAQRGHEADNGNVMCVTHKQCQRLGNIQQQENIKNVESENL
jgi:hypothetical protein